MAPAEAWGVGAAAPGHQQVQLSRLQVVLPGLCGRAQRSPAWGSGGALQHGCSGPASPARSARWPRGGASRSPDGLRACLTMARGSPLEHTSPSTPIPPTFGLPTEPPLLQGAFPQAVCTRPHPACGSQTRQPKPADCGSPESTPDIWMQGLDGEAPVLVFPSGQTDQHTRG